MGNAEPIPTMQNGYSGFAIDAASTTNRHSHQIRGLRLQTLRSEVICPSSWGSILTLRPEIRGSGFSGCSLCEHAPLLRLLSSRAVGMTPPVREGVVQLQGMEPIDVRD